MVGFEDVTSLSISDRHFTLVKSSLELPGLFVIQQYLCVLIKFKYTVVLVAAEQGVERYKSVAKKLGINLQLHEQSGFLTCITPPLAALDEKEPSSCEGAGGAPQDHDTLEAGPGPGSATSASGGLQWLHGAVCRAVAARPPSAAGVAVVVDSLTVLANACADRREWSAFLHYLNTAALWSGPSQQQQKHEGQQEQLQPVPSCLMAGVYDDVPDDRPWIRALEHRADVVVTVAPLPGRVADVDGMVTVTRRCIAASGTSTGGADPRVGLSPAAGVADLRRSVYFRTSDLSIKWMDRLTDREVL